MSDFKLADGSYPMKIGEREFQACMLTDRDYADLTGYMQAKYIETARNAAKESENGDGKDLLKFALTTAASIEWGTTEGIELITTVEGQLRIGWQMIRKRHNGISFKDFREIAKKDYSQALEMIISTYNHLHHIEGELPEGNSKSE